MMMVRNVSANDDEFDQDENVELDHGGDDLYHSDDELDHDGVDLDHGGDELDHDDDDNDFPCRHVDSLIRQSRAHSMVNL